MNRLRIVDYFDSVVNQTDLKVEEFIRDYQNVVNGEPYIDEINSAREKWIAEIRECEAFNLAECGENKEPIEDRQLFKRFCFLFEWTRDFLNNSLFTWRLVSTDKWLSEKQIVCFQALIKHLTKTDLVRHILDPPCSNSDLSVLFHNIRPDQSKVK